MAGDTFLMKVALSKSQQFRVAFIQMIWFENAGQELREMVFRGEKFFVVWFNHRKY